MYLILDIFYVCLNKAFFWDFMPRLIKRRVEPQKGEPQLCVHIHATEEYLSSALFLNKCEGKMCRNCSQCGGEYFLSPHAICEQVFTTY